MSEFKDHDDTIVVEGRSGQSSHDAGSVGGTNVLWVNGGSSLMFSNSSSHSLLGWYDQNGYFVDPTVDSDGDGIPDVVDYYDDSETIVVVATSRDTNADQAKAFVEEHYSAFLVMGYEALKDRLPKPLEDFVDSHPLASDAIVYSFGEATKESAADIAYDLVAFYSDIAQQLRWAITDYLYDY